MKLLLATLGLVLVSSAQAQTPSPAPPATDKNSGPPVEEIFKKFDTNHDGTLSLDEFKAGHEKMHAKHDKGDKPWADRKAMMAQRMDDHFKSLDKNADGKISKQEASGTRLANRFDQLDTNHDGSVTKDEMKSGRAAMHDDSHGASSSAPTAHQDHL